MEKLNNGTSKIKVYRKKFLSNGEMQQYKQGLHVVYSSINLESHQK